MPPMPSLAVPEPTPVNVTVAAPVERWKRIWSKPTPPSIVSLPAMPSSALLRPSPVRVSLNADPRTCSMLSNTSAPSAPVDEPMPLPPEPRLTCTAPLALSYRTRSVPLPPSMVSLPPRPSKNSNSVAGVMLQLLLPPVSTSPDELPCMPSKFEMMSLPPQPSLAVPRPRFTVTPMVDCEYDTIEIAFGATLPVRVSLPPMPSTVSPMSVAKNCTALAAALPSINMSANAPPRILSMFNSTSLPSAPVAVPLARLTMTAPVAP